MTSSSRQEPGFNLQGLLTSLDCVCLAGISAAALLAGRKDAAGAPPFDTLHATLFAIPDLIFIAIFVLLWSGLFRKMHERGGDLLDTAATLVLILRNCVGLALCAGVYVAIAQGRGRSVYAALTFLLFSVTYEVVRVWGIGAVKTALLARDPEVVVILGSGRQAGKAWRLLRTRYFATVRLLGFVDDLPRTDLPPDIAVRYLGRVEDLNELLRRNKVNRIVVAVAEPHSSHTATRAIEIAQNAGVKVSSLDDFLLAYA